MKDKKLMIIKGKKAQFYVLTAVIFCSVMFILLSNKNPTQETNSEFKRLYNNYIYEVPQVINNALYDNKNVSAQFKNFTSNFISYAKEKNINLGIFYILKLDEQIEAVNLLNQEVNITYVDSLLLPDKRIILRRTSNISVIVKNTTYVYNITDDKIQFKVLLMKQ
jgi:hypothetical protein